MLRIWEPMVQEHIGAVAYEMLSRGASVNDKDGLTDMSLLHFAAKSGARGLGDMGKVRQTPSPRPPPPPLAARSRCALSTAHAATHFGVL